MATYTGRNLGRGLAYNGKKFQSESIYGTLTYTETVHSDNSVTLTLNSLTVNQSAQVIDPNIRPQHCTVCCGGWSLRVGSDFGGGTLLTWSLGTSLPLGNRSWTRGSGKSYHVAPGGSISVELYSTSGPSPCGFISATFSYTNHRTKPSPTPPSLSPSCYASTANGNTIVFSGGGGWGYCENQSNSSSYAIYDSDSMTTPIKSGSGYSTAVSGLSPNTRYWASFHKSNGCYSRSATCTAVTVTPNALSDPSPSTWDKATVRLAVTNGGGEYDPTTAIYIKKCTSSSWTKVADSTTKSVEVINLENLEAETCYEVQARTTTPAGTYTGNTVTFNTPKKGLCIAEFTKIEPGMDEKTYEATADICYRWQTTKVPATIVVRYQVKDGYDKTWYESEKVTVNELTGEYCLTLRDLYPNQTVYQTYIHTETDEATYDSPMSEFITAVVPEPDIHNCENFTYMTELLCQAVKKLLHGNKVIYANPASQALCDPYNEDPTMLTLWSRALRLFHAMYCLVCDMGGARLTASKPGQYLVGEAGWQDIIKIIDENATADNWKIATSDAIWQYLQEKLHGVWHFHGSVDVLVYSVDDLTNFPDATSAVVVAENAICRKVDGEWVKSTAEEDKIDDMGVWHIDTESSTHSDDRTYYVQAGSAWYQWQGDWQPLDADVIAYAKIIDAMWEKRDQVVYNEVGSGRLHVRVQDRLEFSCDTPNDERWVTFITEPLEVIPIGYHLLKFETGENATIIQNQEVLDGALAQQPNDPEKYCMDFVTWNDKETGTEYDWSLPVTADHTLVAVWEPHPVKIQFSIGDKGQGTVPSDIDGFCGDTIGTLPTDSTFSRPGGTFMGWEINGVPIDSSYILEESATAEAVWQMEQLNVTFVLGNGEPNVVKVVEYEETAEPPVDPERTDYIFTGWYSDSAMTTKWDATVPIQVDTTVYAGWIPARYTVTFNTDGGTPVPSQTVAYEGYATRPADPTKDGYIIKEWQLDGVTYNFDAPVTEDIALVAIWQKVWTVTFDTDGGEPAVDAQTVIDGELANIPPSPAKEGCEFSGWYDTSGDVPECPAGPEPIPTPEEVSKDTGVEGYLITPPKNSSTTCGYNLFSGKWEMTFKIRDGSTWDNYKYDISGNADENGVAVSLSGSGGYGAASNAITSSQFFSSKMGDGELKVITNINDITGCYSATCLIGCNSAIYPGRPVGTNVNTSKPYIRFDFGHNNPGKFTASMIIPAAYSSTGVSQTLSVFEYNIKELIEGGA